MYPRVRSIIDHRWHQNEARTTKWQKKRSYNNNNNSIYLNTIKNSAKADVCHWCSSHILTSSAIYFCTDPQQYGIYLFYKIIKNKQILMVTSTIHLSSSRNQSNVCIVQLIIYYLVDTTLHVWLTQAKMSAKGKRFTPYCFLYIFQI